ncbi:hypothetical protein MJD09_16865 [bacterium]|nr:hypothetical protein [bacterium]
MQRSSVLNEKLMVLGPEDISAKTSEKDLILVGYFFAGIYSTFEEIFVKIAREFENKIDDPASWHSEILNRMTLEIEDIRPAVISKESKNCLDELRQFRHVFSFSYAFELNWEKLLIAVKQWSKNSQSI